jgi:hypothetical protein
MKISEIFTDTFKALRHELGHDRPRDLRPMWQQRLSVDSDFCRALVANSYLTEAQMRHAAERYRLGMSRDGGVIYWQIDQTEQVYDGKIMYYHPDCHRDHDRHPQWVSNLLKRHYLRDDKKLIAAIPSYHCLFGTHLLTNTNCTNQTIKKESVQSVSSVVEQNICVVEAEKTAVIMSEVKPQYLWLAAGGLYELTPAKMFPLRGRRITLFPDTDTEGKAYATWYKVMQEAQRLLGHPIHLSPLLEQRATREQKERKIDLVDFIFRG